MCFTRKKAETKKEEDVGLENRGCHMRKRQMNPWYAGERRLPDDGCAARFNCVKFRAGREAKASGMEMNQEIIPDEYGTIFICLYRELKAVVSGAQELRLMKGGARDCCF